MNRRSLPLVAVALGLLAGCNYTNIERNMTANRCDGPDGQECRGGAPVNAFGERMDGQAGGFENRMLANVTQHTFATIGRDFDPDIRNEGTMLAFASTSHSEHPDIYLKHVDGYVVTQLTSDPADDVQPRFSPDGQMIAFCSNRTGNWDIWTVHLDGTNLTQLTRDSMDEIAPCWSPDGKQIAFSVWGKRSQQWEIWVLSVDQPGVRRFLAYGLFPDWAPDGSRIAFQRARQRGTRWFSVWVTDLVGREARNPTEVAYSDAAACIAPRWSPDGKSLACCTVSRGMSIADSQDEDFSRSGSDLWVVDAQNGVRRKLTDGAATAFNPVWSPDGRVYFVSARGGVENIWSVSSDITMAPRGGDAPMGEHPQSSRASEPAHPVVTAEASAETQPRAAMLNHGNAVASGHERN